MLDRQKIRDVKRAYKEAKMKAVKKGWSVELTRQLNRF